MLHSYVISTIFVGLRLTEETVLSHCTDVENGVGYEMINLFGNIMKHVPLRGINSNLRKLWITGHLS